MPEGDTKKDSKLKNSSVLTILPWGQIFFNWLIFISLLFSKYLFKSNLKLILIAIFGCFLFLLNQCKKDYSVFDVYFWTSKTEIDGTLTLYIDDINKGILPYSALKPECANDTSLSNLLYVHLSAGKYKIEAKDENGVLKIKGTMKYKENTRASSVTKGGMSIVGNGDGNCDVVMLFE